MRKGTHKFEKYDKTWGKNQLARKLFSYIPDASN